MFSVQKCKSFSYIINQCINRLHIVHCHLVFYKWLEYSNIHMPLPSWAIFTWCCYFSQIWLRVHSQYWLFFYLSVCSQWSSPFFSDNFTPVEPNPSAPLSVVSRDLKKKKIKKSIIIVIITFTYWSQIVLWLC